MADATSPVTKNPYKDKSYDELLKFITENAGQIAKAIEAVSLSKKDSVGRDVKPPTDQAAQVILALTVFNGDFTKQMRECGGNTEMIDTIKRKARDARRAMATATRLTQEVAEDIAAADSMLATQQRIFAEENVSVIDARIKQAEAKAKKAQETIAKLQEAKKPKARRARASAQPNA